MHYAAVIYECQTSLMAARDRSLRSSCLFPTVRRCNPFYAGIVRQYEAYKANCNLTAIDTMTQRKNLSAEYNVYGFLRVKRIILVEIRH